MESRPVTRRGSALAIVLVIAALLGGLLVLCAAQFSSLQSEVEDSLFYGRLETAARDALERATVWVERNKPVGPSGGFDNISMASGDSADRLELSLPSDISSSVSGSITTSVTAQWCVFTPSSGLVASSLYPPAIIANESGVEIFQQTYDHSGADAAQFLSAERGAWRLIVRSQLTGSETSTVRRVTLERVLVLDR